MPMIDSRMPRPLRLRASTASSNFMSSFRTSTLTSFSMLSDEYPLPKFVHVHRKTQIVQPVDDNRHQIAVFNVGAFGNFNRQQARVDAVFADQLLERGKNVQRVQIPARHIDGNGNGRVSPFHPFAKRAAHFFPKCAGQEW